jgi:SOS response regulatory protein OraA/RecX
MGRMIMETLEQRMRYQAIDWLAQREYSRHELAQRLLRQFSRFGQAGRGVVDRSSFDGVSVDNSFVDSASSDSPSVDNSAIADSTVSTTKGTDGQFTEAHKLPLTPVLDWLEEQRFLDDTRCARVFARSHIERGHGPLRIRQELIYRKGLNTELVEREMVATGCDWFDLATVVRAKRFPDRPVTLKEKARQLRFLQGRGFTSEQCYHALTDDVSDSILTQ